jgi:outer membrane protein assembly factor BamB
MIFQLIENGMNFISNSIKFIFLFISFFVSLFVNGQVVSEWRGPARTGVYSDTGLLKSWPENGPPLLWISRDLPKGNSSVATGNNKLFITGLMDTLDVLVALDTNGLPLWKTPYGKAWPGAFPESRSTPTLDGDRVYVTSGNGDLACIDANDGKLNWTMNSLVQFAGTVGRWGIAESPLIVGNKVIYTCGGVKTTLVALDKMNGETIWMTASLGDNVTYSSPLLIERHGKKQIVAVTEQHILGVDPENGKIAWTFNYGDYTSEEKRNNHPNTPLYFDGKLFMSSGYDHKSVMLELSENITSAKLIWIDSTLDVHLGGMVKIGSYIYGSNWINNSNGNWACLNWDTGRVQYETKWYNKGAIIAADELLYCYEEKSGHLALVHPTPEKFDVISSFKIPYGSGPHWAHPVIHNKILYVRHNEVLLAYSISASGSR